MWELLFLLVTPEEGQRERNRLLLYFPKAELGCLNVPSISSSMPQGDELGSSKVVPKFTALTSHRASGQVLPQEEG